MNQVGAGSGEQDLLGRAVISFLSSSSVTSDNLFGATANYLGSACGIAA